MPPTTPEVLRPKNVLKDQDPPLAKVKGLIISSISGRLGISQAEAQIFLDLPLCDQKDIVEKRTGQKVTPKFGTNIRWPGF